LEAGWELTNNEGYQIAFIFQKNKNEKFFQIIVVKCCFKNIHKERHQGGTFHMRHQTIKFKLAAVVILMAVSTLSIGLYSLYFQRHLKTEYEYFLNEVQIQKQLQQFQFKVVGISNDERAYLLNGDHQFTVQIQEKRQEAEAALTAIYNGTKNDEVRQITNETKAGFEKFMEVHKKVVSFYEDGEINSAVSLHFTDERTIRKEVLDPSVNKLVAVIDENLVKDSKVLEELEKKNAFWQITLVAALIAFSIYMGLALARSILTPLRAVKGQLKEMAGGQGDLTKELDIQSNDEIGELAMLFNEFTKTLRNMVVKVTDVSASVTAAADQLVGHADQMLETSLSWHSGVEKAAGASQFQMSSAYENAAAIDETSQHVDKVTAHLSDVFGLTSHADMLTKQGKAFIERTKSEVEAIDFQAEEAVRQMNTLNGYSENISRISSIIQSISDQTNLLALNASIEAARAGDAGKGFSVVADEVRKLAKETSQSTNDITETINSLNKAISQTEETILSTKRVGESGRRSVEETAEKFQAIEASMTEIHEKIVSIADSSQEMNGAMEEASASVQAIANSVQESSDTAQHILGSSTRQLKEINEIHEIAMGLNHRTKELQSLMKVFNV
jgi:methyl-accepting chemotaxis protein